MLSAVNHTSIDELESELLKKIEIGKLSRQLKTKLSAINKKINGQNASSAQYPYSVSKLPRRVPSRKSYESPTRVRRTRVVSSPFHHVASPSRFSSPSTTPLKRKYEAVASSETSRNKQKHTSSVLSTPKSKVVRTTRHFSGNENDDEGANLLMFLATSPQSHKSSNHYQPHFMSSPIGTSKLYHEFVNSNIPSTPRHTYKSFSSPYVHPDSNNTPSTVTPKVQSTSVFANHSNLSSTIIRTPKFNMSDYVNFMSPSPCAKKGASASYYAKTPDRNTVSVAERLSKLETISSHNLSIIDHSKDEETEEEQSENSNHYMSRKEDETEEDEE